MLKHSAPNLDFLMWHRHPTHPQLISLAALILAYSFGNDGSTDQFAINCTIITFQATETKYTDMSFKSQSMFIIYAFGIITAYYWQKHQDNSH